jgi:membrane associated rhomboid family serine protease
MIFFPIAVDVPMQRWPWMNWLILGAMALLYLVQLGNEEAVLPLVLGVEAAQIEFLGYVEVEESVWAWVGHMFLHADVLHLFGNMVFLWVFGNAVCAKVGNLVYLPLWLMFGLVAAASERMVFGGALLGASGAINGVVGMFLILYPVNDITIAYWFIVKFGTFTLSSYWMIALWLGFDVLGALTGDDGVAYVAHLGGFAAGAGLALALVKMRVIEANEYERTLLDVMRDRKHGTKPRRGHAAPVQVQQRLFVRLRNGAVKQLPVSEFQRHEEQGKVVNDFPVSEDGQTWTTFGAWRQQHGV